MSKLKGVKALELIRIVVGLIFLWPFLDKTFGLGFSTTADKSWLMGGSPTEGFLKFGTKGPLAAIFHNLAGSIIVDWLFMMGLLGVGLALILGVGMRIATYSGSLMMFLIYLAAFPPEHNPIFDEHVVYIFLLIYLKDKAGFEWGLRNVWAKTSLVKKYGFLE